MADYKVVVTDDRYGAYREEEEVVQAIGGRLEVHDCTTPEEVAEVVRDADGVIANLAPINASVIEAMTRCRVISRYGVGYDNVDVEAATRKGIYVTNVPGFCAEDVSDHAIALVMACARRIVMVDKAVRGGQWNVSQKQPIYRFKDKVWGLIGYGFISKLLHKKMKGFSLRDFLVYDPFVSAEVIEEAGGRKVELDQLLSESDIITVHTPLTPETKGMISREQFERMKSTAIVVNVARGPVVDQAALLEALQTGQIMAAGIDVFEQEPPSGDNPLLQLDNIVVTDHAGWYTIESMAELKRRAAENVAAVLTEGKPVSPVNKIDENK
jgi:D-3-phosphoglycerate dehydrogenase